ncbi:MAG TPA: ABC transporter permease [Steroidobacteraceae bacterium]|jgi:putative ABC transport system permease protein|nr:ABC transporter permease [Steroidobacteraceae bacterium]
MLDGLQEILFTLRQNKLRTLLTAFGVFWGIFMLIMLLGAGRGMQHGVYDDFGSDVLDFIIVWSGETSVPYHGLSLGRKIRLDDADIQEIRLKVPGVKTISGAIGMGNATVSWQDKNSNSSLQGIPDEYFRIKEDVPFNFGRKINPLDIGDIRKVVVIGTSVAERLFPAGVDPVGKEVKIKEVVMKIVGVFHDKGNRGRDSENVYMPLTTARKVFGGADRIDTIWLRPVPGVDGFAVEKSVLELVKRRHDVAPDDHRGVNSFNMEMPMQRVTGLFIGIDVFIWFVGLGTLMAGIVGISNIMIITVKERTREIGIRKALGATPFSIVSTLLLESTMVTAIAGYLGLVAGVGLLELIAFVLRSSGAKLPYFMNPEVNFRVAITAIVLLVSVGVLAGLMPALRAAKITPTEAMRAE